MHNKYCTKCGKQLVVGMQICSKCGSKVITKKPTTLSSKVLFIVLLVTICLSIVTFILISKQSSISTVYSKTADVFSRWINPDISTKENFKISHERFVLKLRAYNSEKGTWSKDLPNVGWIKGVDDTMTDTKTLFNNSVNQFNDLLAIFAVNDCYLKTNSIDVCIGLKDQLNRKLDDRKRLTDQMLAGCDQDCSRGIFSHQCFECDEEIKNMYTYAAALNNDSLSEILYEYVKSLDEYKSICESSNKYFIDTSNFTKSSDWFGSRYLRDYPEEYYTYTDNLNDYTSIVSGKLGYELSVNDRLYKWVH